MRIIDLTTEYEPTFLACLKDWDEEAVGRCHKARWYDMMKCKGLRVKLALDDSERAVGMIQYVPIEYARAEGRDLYFIQCIWVHGYEEGIGNQNTGMADYPPPSCEEIVQKIRQKLEAMNGTP